MHTEAPKRPHLKELDRYITSTTLEREVALADLSSLHLDDLRKLHLEMKTLIGNLDTQRDKAIDAGAAGCRPVDLEWLGRLRGKRHLACVFEYGCRQEIAFRYQQTELAKIESITSRHSAHQTRLKRFEYLKRRAFMGLLREQLGNAAVDALVQRATAIATAEQAAEEHDTLEGAD